MTPPKQTTRRSIRVDFSSLRRERDRQQRLFDAPLVPASKAMLACTHANDPGSLAGQVFVFHEGDPRANSLDWVCGAGHYSWERLSTEARLALMLYWVEHWLPAHYGIPARRGRHALMRIAEYRELVRLLPTLRP